jgi:hypothetical protein
MTTYTDKAAAMAAGGNVRSVLEYSEVMKQLVDAAKQPGFTEASWAPLAAMVDVENFVRVGCFKEVVDWKQYAAILTQWATSSQWECSFKRVTEDAGRVFLELEERSQVGDSRDVVNSLTVYEFNAAGKLQHLDIYLQRAMDQTSTGGWEQAGAEAAA